MIVMVMAMVMMMVTTTMTMNLLQGRQGGGYGGGIYHS